MASVFSNGYLAPVVVEVRDENLETLKDKLHLVAEVARTVPGLVDLYPSLQVDYPEVRVETDRQTAAADWKVDGTKRPGMLSQQLHPDRALTRDDVRIIEGVHHDEAAALCQRPGMSTRRVETITFQHNLAAKAANRFDLDRWRRGRHHYDRANAKTTGRKRYSLGMITGGSADHPARTISLLAQPSARDGPAR